MTHSLKTDPNYLKNKYPNIAGLARYFHQDWMYQYPNWYSALDDYLYGEDISLTYQEINGMLQEFDERQLESAFVFSMNCNYGPEDDGDTYIVWLRKIQAYIQNFEVCHKLEDAYALQITGSAQKYPVGDAMFDGYDATRQVLLFTRLFCFIEVPSIETLKEDVLLGKLTAWDEYHGRPYLIKYRNLGSYARHQLSQLDYFKDTYPYRSTTQGIIKDTTPIEWHIGIQAHAESLQYMLNGSTGLAIPESRLKVIYTPYIPPTPELALP